MAFSLDNGLAGRRIIVTGAGGGIGGAVTRLAIELGMHVAASDVDIDRLQQTIDDAKGGPGTAVALPLDLRDGAAIKRGVREAEEAMGGLNGIAPEGRHPRTTSMTSPKRRSMLR